MHTNVLRILRCISKPSPTPPRDSTRYHAPSHCPTPKPSHGRPRRTIPSRCKCHDQPNHKVKPPGSSCKGCQHWKIKCECVYPDVTPPCHPPAGHFARDCGMSTHGPHPHAKHHHHPSGHGPTACYRPVPSSCPTHGPGNMAWTKRQQQTAAVISALTFEVPSHDSLLRMALQAPLRFMASVGKEQVTRVIWDSGASLSLSNSKADFVGDFKPAPIWVRLRGLAKGLKIEGEGHVLWAIMDTKGML